MPDSDALQLGLLKFRQAVSERRLGVEGLHIARDGQGPVATRWVSDDRREVYSVSKTFTSVAIGIARGEGLLDLDDRVLEHFPDFVGGAAPGVEEITIRQLLTMTAGIDYRWEDPDSDHPGDVADDFLSTPMHATPGSLFAYRGTNFYLLSRILSAVTGQDIRDFLMPRLFIPLHIGNPQWLRCPLGFSMGALGLQLRTEEISRLGITLLHRGVYESRQLIPAEYVDLMHERSITSDLDGVEGTYGLGCWHCERDDAWRMDGMYGQFSIVLPHQGACITLTSHHEGPTTDILDAVWDDLVPYL